MQSEYRRPAPYIKLDTNTPLPTVQDEMRGQIRLDPFVTGTPDTLMVACKREDGTIGWVSLSGITVQESDVTLDNRMSTLDFNGNHFDLTEDPDGEANISIAAPLSMTIGPLYVPDIPGTATTSMVPGYYDGAAFVLGGSAEFYAPMNGWITAMMLNSRNSRSAGTATLKGRIGGVTTAFNGDAVQLNATNTLRIASAVTPANGIAFSAGDRIGLDLVTSGWTPTTTDATAWFTIQMKPT